VRDGLSPKEAQRQLQSLPAAHGESSRDRMRQIFKDVPVIYGFSSTAPLGPVAASSLNRYLRAQGDREITQSHPSNRLLDTFAAFGMSSARGITDKDPHAQARREMCQFADERLSTATKLAFVHELLQRHFGEARLHLDRIQRLMAGLDDRARRTPAVAQALEDIGRDATARTRWLEQARESEQPSVRVRLIDLAHDVGWLFSDRRYPDEPRLPGLATLACVEAERVEAGKASRSTRYYLSSAPLTPETFARSVRGHWKIENSLHWVLAVTFVVATIIAVASVALAQPRQPRPPCWTRRALGWTP